MSFRYVNENLHCDGVDLRTIAQRYGTPAYIYSESLLRRNAEVVKQCFVDQGFKVSYAMKANPNPEILKIFREYGFGVDIVSAGELRMASDVEYQGSEINYAGVGKTTAELDFALEQKIDHFNVESLFELKQLETRAAELGTVARVLLRLNPDIDPKTHPHISTGLKHNKFGMEPDKVFELLAHPEVYPHIIFNGIHCHIGSQIIRPQPYYELLEYLDIFTTKLISAGINITHLDFGGGFGVNYEDPFEDILESTTYLESFAKSALELFRHYQLQIQPGRILVANSAVLLSQVLGIKHNGNHSFVVIDGATTDLIRPALYDAHHAIHSCRQSKKSTISDVVGPVCESSDALARERRLPLLERGDLLTIGSAGAYASSMGSTYNMRPLSPEIMINMDGQTRVIRNRQTFEDMTRLYKCN